MAAVVPTTVMKNTHYADLMYGTSRRLVKAYIECEPASTASPAVSDTLDLSTYVPGLTAISAIEGFSASFASIPTFSGTTLTFPGSVSPYGTIKFRVLGYY